MLWEDMHNNRFAACVWKLNGGRQTRDRKCSEVSDTADMMLRTELTGVKHHFLIDLGTD